VTTVVVVVVVVVAGRRTNGRGRLSRMTNLEVVALPAGDEDLQIEDGREDEQK
jgi:hypothetical protein